MKGPCIFETQDVTPHEVGLFYCAFPFENFASRFDNAFRLLGGAPTFLKALRDRRQH